jgi:hypothetical protein
MTALTYEQWRERWEKAHAAALLIYRADKKTSAAKVRSVIAFLKSVRDHKDKRGRLSDPRFNDMAQVIEGFHLDHSPRTAYYRHVDSVCVVRIEQLARNGASVRIAAARTAVEFHVHNGHSFSAVTKRLERAHRRWCVGQNGSKKRTTNPKMGRGNPEVGRG